MRPAARRRASDDGGLAPVISPAIRSRAWVVACTPPMSSAERIGSLGSRRAGSATGTRALSPTIPTARARRRRVGVVARRWCSGWWSWDGPSLSVLRASVAWRCSVCGVEGAAGAVDAGIQVGQRVSGGGVGAVDGRGRGGRGGARCSAWVARRPSWSRRRSGTRRRAWTRRRRGHCRIRLRAPRPPPLPGFLRRVGRCGCGAPSGSVSARSVVVIHDRSIDVRRQGAVSEM